MRTVTRNILATISAATLTALLLTPASTQAQTNVYTDPVGFVSQPVVGNGYTYVALPLTQIPVQRGIIGNAASTTLTDNSGSWTNGQFNGNGGVAYFIEITSGPVAGLMDDIVATTGPNQIQTADDLVALTGGAANISNQTYKIYPHWTLNTAFGTPAQSGLNGSNTAANADNLFVWNPVTQSGNTYWYRTTSVTPGWRSSASGTALDAGTNVLYIEQGIVIQRKIAPAATNIVVGAVKLGSTISPVVANGYTYCGNVYAGAYTNLNQMLLYTGSPTTGIQGSNTAANADNVLIWDPINQNVNTYWFRTTSVTPGWRSSATGTATDASTNQIPVGSIIVVQRKINSSFNWVMPSPY